MKNQIKYLSHIQGLRAIAIIAVITNHYFEKTLDSGFLGVDVFFVISGFVITKYLNESSFKSIPDFLFQFYSKRIKSIFPALIFFILIIALV
jgi:peptidoglycan/LPS O-acetylase OafA/YrhL